MLPRESIAMTFSFQVTSRMAMSTSWTVLARLSMSMPTSDSISRPQIA